MELHPSKYTTSGTTQLSRISEWFESLEDKEFIEPDFMPYSVIPPLNPAAGVLYTTKQQAVLRTLCEFSTPPFALVARYGLPRMEHVKWIRKFAGDRVIAFLGDCDPPDLLVFAYLQMQMPIVHLGVGDSLLTKMAVDLREGMTISFSSKEREAMDLVCEVLPNFESLLGPRCADLLKTGRKLEVEALVSYSGLDARGKLDALLP